MKLPHMNIFQNYCLCLVGNGQMYTADARLTLIKLSASASSILPSLINNYKMAAPHLYNKILYHTSPWILDFHVAKFLISSLHMQRIKWHVSNFSPIMAKAVKFVQWHFYQKGTCLCLSMIQFQFCEK